MLEILVYFIDAVCVVGILAICVLMIYFTFFD